MVYGTCSCSSHVDYNATITRRPHAIGWSTHYFKGTRGVIQKSSWEVEELIKIVKVRLWLRCHVHHLLPKMTPEQMICHGLMDPVPMFVKGEGHAAKKQTSKRWRLIWNVSQVDTSIEICNNKTFDKSLILAYQEGALNTAAIGIGHHDQGIARVGETIEMLKSLGKDRCFSSDASGWDLSVSSNTAWAMNTGAFITRPLR